MVTLPRTPGPGSLEHTVALPRAGVDLSGVKAVRRDTLRAAIARHGGYCDWRVDHTGWVVTLYFPEERTFSGGTLEDGLATCLAWLVARERQTVLSGV